eukprot:TRINITY_DN9906_c0_g1_i1.p1 TRINITY_DN9906_c0_g1~~TRINITY_DN9906_c0_g1_i1.p1  ORF type:complete len:100 (+),score=20.42 TRINITY_DN9906_c0_g1_i1:296-595(+)
MFNPTTVELGLICVDPDHQSKGLGYGLVSTAIDYSKQHFSASKARIMVISIREDIIAWYKKIGFQPTNEFENFPPPEAGVGVPREGVGKLQFTVMNKDI